MKESVAILLFAALATPLVGCSFLETQAGPRIARGVMHYCAEPVDARLLLRAEVNKLAAPNSVQVNCAADVSPAK